MNVFHRLRERFGQFHVDRRWLAFLPLLAALVWAYRDLVAFDPYGRRPGEIDDVEGWFFSPTSASPTLIYVLTLWLVARRLPRLLGALGAGGWRPILAGASGIALSQGLVVWAYYVYGLDLLTASLSLLLLSGGLFLAGTEGMKAMGLPADFMLVLASPHPAVIVNQIVFPLQLVTARLAVWVLDAVGMTAIRVGDQIITGDHIFHVIETCSGMRAMETLVMTAVVYAEIFHRSRRRLVILLLLAPLIGFLVNQLRVLSMILNPLSSFAAVHTAQGVAMLVAGVLLLHGSDRVLCRLLPDERVPSRSSGYARRRAVREAALPHARLVILAVAVLAAGAVSVFVEPWKPAPPQAASVHTISRQLGDWVADPKPLESQKDFLGSTRFSQSTDRRYRRGAEAVDFFFAVDDHLHRTNSAHSPKTALPGAGWEVLSHAGARGDSDGRIIEELVLVAPDRERMLVQHWREQFSSVPVEGIRAFLGLDRSPLRRPERARVFRLGTKLDGGPDELAAARRRLEEFKTVALPAADALEGKRGVR